MGNRRHRRVKMVLPIRISGGDANGVTFSQLAHTLDFSRGGARIGGVQSSLRVGDEITVEYKRERGRFKVRWTCAERFEIGVENLFPDKFVFIALPQLGFSDEFDASGRSRHERPPGLPQPQPAAVASGAPAKLQPPVGSEMGEDGMASVGSPPFQLTSAAGGLACLKSKLHESQQDTDSLLQLVVATTRELLPASGAAIAVAGGEDWICRASSGVAPRVGLRFRSPAGLTGQAISTGSIIICRDSDQDDRVSRSLWRSVRLRSAASIPIQIDSHVIAVLEVFGERPDAFGYQHEALFCEVGHIVGELINSSKTA